MCIGIPGRIIEIAGWNAVADAGGATREINVMLVDGVAPGDYVIIHAGYAISKIDEREADDILSTLQEITERYAVDTRGDSRK